MSTSSKRHHSARPTRASQASSVGISTVSLEDVLSASVVSTAGASAAMPTQSLVDYTSHQQLLETFTEPYLIAHRLSHPSRRYPDYLWFGIIGIFIVWSIEHVITRGGYNGSFGALQRKIGIRRFAFGPGAKARKSAPPTNDPSTNKSKPKKISHRKFIPGAKRLWTTPTVAQMVSMILMMGGIYAVCFWGDDYVNPDQCFWGGLGCAPANAALENARNFSSSFQQTYVPGHLNPRQSHNRRNRGMFARKHTSRTVDQSQERPIIALAANTNSTSLTAASTKAIHRNLWTSADRIGMIAFALTPLVVTLAMKMWPFAAFSVPFLMSYEFDKTVMYHRWIGIIIWTLSTAHTALWTVQLVNDRDPLGKPVLYGMIYYWHFEAAIVAYVALTLMVIFSFTRIRAKYYEFFYASHMILGILFLVGCILHFWRAAVYVFIACGIWAAERSCRLIHWLWLNGFTKGLSFGEVQSTKLAKIHNMATRRRPMSEKYNIHTNGKQKRMTNRISLMLRKASGDWSAYPPNSPSAMSFASLAASQPAWRPSPPPGFALAQLLPGKNIRLTIRTPSIIHWRTGQYTTLTIPSISKFQAHPFTIANTDERQIRNVDYPIGSEIVLLIGARQGFTKRLWDHIVGKRKMFGESATSSSGGVLLRAQVSKPLGTAGRARLDDFDTALIICGGTGVSFGMAVMEHCCMSMSVRDSGVHNPTNRKASRIKRVRFVWIVREFAHLSWVAPAVRRCMDMCPPESIRIDFFVTRGTRIATPNVSPTIAFAHDSERPLEPPRRPFSTHRRQASVDSNISDDEEIRHTPRTRTLSTYNNHEVMDFVLFDGEHQDQTAAEMQWSQHVQQEGKLRRAKSRKAFGGKRNRPARFQKRTENPLSQVTEKTPFDDATSDLIDQYANDLDEDRYADAEYSQDMGTPLPFYEKEPEADVLIEELIEKPIVSPFRDNDLDLDVSPSELDDLHIISELARTGHPDVKAVMLEEQEKSEGKMIVACCGPVALNINIRRLVAEMIDPVRVAKGDQRGQVALTVEDFE